jgi:TolB-like protein
MKKYFAALLVILLGAGFVFAQDTLDTTIRHASGNLGNRIPLKSKILVLHFKADSTELQDYIIDGLIGGLKKNPGFSVLEKRNTFSIIESNDLSITIELSDDKAISIAKNLGVNAVVFGAIVPSGDGYRFNVQAVSTQTGKEYWSNTYTIQEDNTLASLVSK